MKKRVIKITAGLAAMLVIILGLTGLDYLVNMDRKEDPVTRNVQAAKKDSYNQYGLPLDTELADQPFYEDETYIYYTDRLLKKFQYKENNLEMASIILEKMQGLVPEDVNQYCMLIPKRTAWEDGNQEQKNLYSEFLEKAEKTVPDKMEFLDILPILNEHSDEYLFFRTYNGWTARGAYYGSRLLCESMGVTPIELEGYEEHMYGTFKGADKQEMSSIYAQNTEMYTKLDAMPSDPLFAYLLPGSKNRALRVKLENGIEVTDKIQTFSKSRVGENAFIGSNQWALAEGDGKDSDKKEDTALLLCDANGQLLVPFLTSYYKQVYVIDLVYNQFSIEQFKDIFQEYNISDVILSQSADEFGDLSKSILLTKIYVLAN